MTAYSLNRRHLNLYSRSFTTWYPVLVNFKQVEKFSFYHAVVIDNASPLSLKNCLGLVIVEGVDLNFIYGEKITSLYNLQRMD